MHRVGAILCAGVVARNLLKPSRDTGMSSRFFNGLLPECPDEFIKSLCIALWRS